MWRAENRSLMVDILGFHNTNQKKIGLKKKTQNLKTWHREGNHKQNKKVVC